MPSDPSEETDGGLQELNLDQPTPDLGARRQQIRQMVDARATQEFQQAHPFSPFEQPPVPTNRYRQAEATVLEQDRADAMAQRAQEVARRRQQTTETEAYNSQARAQYEGSGQLSYIDPLTKRLVPVLEPGTNRPLFKVGDKSIGQDRQGLPAIIQRDKYGQNQYRRPPLRASEDPLEGQLYADLGDGQSVPYMSVDDALKHPDIQVRRQGMVADRARKNALRAASEEERKNALAPLEGAVTSADLQIKAARDRRDELEQAIAKLTDEIGGAAQTEAETTGLIMKTPTQRALVAKKINDQRRAQLSGLQNEADAIDESLKPRGALSGLKADAESKRATFKAQAIIATYDDQIAMLQDRMKSGGGNPEKDAKTLATMQAARKAIADGLEAHTPQAKPPAVQPAEEAVPEQPAPNPAVMTTGQALASGGALPTIPTAPSPASNLPAEWAKSSPLERLKMLFGVRGYGQNEVEGAVPMIGSEAAGTKGGAFTIPKAQGTGVMAGIDNAVNKFISGMTTPENAGIMAATGGAGALADLAAATRVAVAARATEAATMGTFTGLMAKDTVTATQDAAAVMNDPKATKAEKADAIATAILSGAMTGAAGAGTADLVGRTRAEARATGRTPPTTPEAGAPAPTEPTPVAPTDEQLSAAKRTPITEPDRVARRTAAIDQMSPEEQAAKLAEMETEGSVIPAEPPLSRIPAPPTEIKSAEDSAIAFGASDPANRIPPQRSAQEAAQPFIEQEYREAAYRDDPLGADPERYAAELRQKINESNEAWNARVRDLEVEARRAGQADAFEAAFAEQERQLRSPQGATDLGEHLGREGESNAELMTQRRADVEQRRQEQAQRAEGMEAGLAEQERIRQSQRGGELLREDLRGNAGEEPSPTTAPVAPVPIGPRDPTVSTGTGVPTAKEEAMLKEQRRLVEEHLNAQRTAQTEPASPDKTGTGVVEQARQPVAPGSAPRADYEAQGQKFDRELSEQRRREDEEMAKRPIGQQNPHFWVRKEMERRAIERGLSPTELREVEPKMVGTLRAMIGNVIKRQIAKREPVHKGAVDSVSHDFGIKLPKGYELQGDTYVFKEPPTNAPSPRPAIPEAKLPRAEERPAVPENQKEVRAAKGAEPDDGNRAGGGGEGEGTGVVREVARNSPERLNSSEWDAKISELDRTKNPSPDQITDAENVILVLKNVGQPGPEMGGLGPTPEIATALRDAGILAKGKKNALTEKGRRALDSATRAISGEKEKIYQAQDALSSELPADAATVDKHGLALPEGYVREGDQYVFKTPAPKPAGTVAEKSDVRATSDTNPAQMKPAGDKGDTLIARSKPKPRADVDNGTRYSEWRIRKVTAEDYEKLSEGQRSRGDASVGDFKVERRIIKTEEGGPTETGEWETSSYGKTKKEAVEDAHYEQGYMDAESLDPAHEKAVQDSRARVEELRKIEANKAADLKAEDELREKYIQEVRATPLKGTSREIDIAFNDADGNPSTRKESAMVYGNWAITKKGEGKRAEYVVTHVPTGLKVQSKPTVGQAKEVIQAFIHSGLDVASKDLVSDRDTVAKLAQAARALNGGTAPEWFKGGGESSPSQSVAVTPESRQEKLRQQALRETERVRKAAAAEAPKVKPMNMAGEVRPDKAQPVPAPEFTNLHPKAQERFNAAWEAKDAKAMSEYLDPQNPGFRAEWEKRTDTKLPKGIGATDKAVTDFFGAEGAPQSLSDRAIAALQKAKIGKPGRILSADPFTVAYDAAIDFAILAIRAGRAVGDVVKLATQRFMAKHPKATPEEVARVTAAINSAVAAPTKSAAPESKPSLLPESLKAAGAPAETINYEVRTQDARKQEASDIIKRDGAAKAEEMITSSELPGDTKVAIGGQLINDKMLSLAKATPEEAVKLANDIQRITAKMQPKLATEAGQTISMFSGIYDDVRTASAMEYIRDAQGKRLEKMGGEEGGKAADEAAKIFNKTKDPAAREKEIEKLKERYTTKPVRRMLDQLKRMEVAKKLNDLGVLTRDDMVEVAGNALGIPGISQKRLKHIAELADRVHTAKNHAERSRAELELSDTLNIYKGVSPLDLEASILTLNILSGPTTQAANILGNTLQGISQIGHAALANPTKVRALVDGILDGIPDGMTQAKSILATGRGSRDFADKTGGSSNVLNTIDYAEDYPSLPKKAADALTTRARMVEKISRFMKAADAVFYYPAREAYARLVTTKLLEGQYKGDELDAKVDQLLHTTTASFESARKQAEGEGYDGIDLGRRVSDIIEERRAQTPIGAEAVKQSERFAAESTYNQEPVGLAGVIYRNLARTSQEANIGGVPILKPWTMFLKVPANVFNETTNFTPIGGVRATFGMQGEKYRKGGSGEGQWRNFNRDERNRLYLKSIVGTTLMAGLVARSIQNPDDTPIVSANGPQDTAKRRQLMNAGWKPYSIRVGDKWISYRDSPLLVPLAVAGHVSDSLRYNKPEPDVTTEQRVADAVLASPQTIFQTSMLSGMADLMASLSGKGGGLQAVGRTLGSIPANLVIPYNRLLQQIDQTFDPKTYDTNAVVGGVPFVRRMGNEIADVQGRPQTYSPSDRFASAESKDPVDRLLLDKNLAIPEVGRDVKIGNRNMTEDEHDLYRKISGQRIRVRLQTIEPRLRGMTREKAQDEIERISREERARLKPRIAAQVPMATAAK